MRAVVVTEYGGSARAVDFPVPVVQAEQILIKVVAAGMNPVDRALADGAWQAIMAATFPMVLGVDVAGTVEGVGEGTSQFALGEAVMGQLLVPPLGSSGTYAEFVAVSTDATLARIPSGLSAVVAASAPTAGMTGLAIADAVGPLQDKTVLIVGAAGGVGSFVTQFAANARAHVIANARDDNAQRMSAYGAAEIVDHTTGPLRDLVARAHPDGVDVLIDLASGAEGFAHLAELVRKGGIALTTLYVADVEALAAADVRAINFQVPSSAELLERVADALATDSIVPPPINRISLEQAPAAFAGKNGAFDGKTVIVI
jgi:NADPH2:quinone reductase